MLVATFFGGAVAAGDVLVIQVDPEAKPERVAGVDKDDCRTLGTRIEKRRCEETAREQAVIYKTQGDVGDILQDDVAASGSTVNRTQSN
jgi:hypothetical protein